MLIDDDRLIFETINDDRWDFGVDNSGNILDENNIQHYIRRFEPMNVDIVSLDRTWTRFSRWEEIQSNGRKSFCPLKFSSFFLFLNESRSRQTAASMFKTIQLNKNDSFFLSLNLK